jgi:hypothetical protein
MSGSQNLSKTFKGSPKEKKSLSLTTFDLTTLQIKE